MSTLKFWDDFLFQNPDLIETLVKKLYAKEVKKNYAKNYEDYKYYEKAADSALPYVKRKLYANDKKPLRNYDGRKGASAKTYLSLLVRFRVKDFLREMELIKRRRYRRTKWLKEQNDPLLEKVHKLLCYEQYSEPSVIDKLKHLDWDLSAIEKTIQSIKEKYPKCGESNSHETPTDDIDRYPAPKDQDGFYPPNIAPPPDEQLIDAEDRLIKYLRDQVFYFVLRNHKFEDKLDGVFIKLLTSSEIERPIKDQIKTIIYKIEKEIVATEEDWLLLKAAHDGEKVAIVAPDIGFGKWEAYGRLRRLKKNLREVIGKDVNKIASQIYKSIKDQSLQHK